MNSFAPGLLGWMVIAMTFAAGGCTTQAQKVRIEQDTKTPALWRMSNDTVRLSVDTTTGRITEYGFVGGRNLLWMNPRPTEKKFLIGGWTNYGGDKIWPWPQKTWGWPPREATGWTVKPGQDGRSLVMTSAPLPDFGSSITRRIELAEHGSQVEITSSFSAGDPSALPFGAWAITQVPQPDSIVLGFSDPAARDRFLNQKVEEMTQSPDGDGRARVHYPKVVKGAKIFADADSITCRYADLTFTQTQTAIHTKGSWEPDTRAQVYIHPQKSNDVPPEVGSYAELEWIAPTLPAQEVQNAPLKVTWLLTPLAIKR